MNTASEHRTCPNCGVAIPANAPQGICPKCLMAAAAVPTNAGQTGGKRPEPPSLERLAAAFPQLEPIEFIGQGGMGAVYKARQKQLDRIVALKVLPPGIGGDLSFAERFTREAKALAKLLHPNIVTLFEFGQADGIYYLLMEYVDGVSLGQLLRSSRVSSREALAIVPQICDALQFAHDHGIVHRDIKPENILLDRRGRVKVADFGLAKLVETGAGKPGSPLPAVASQTDDGAHGVTRPACSLTDAGKVMGTPNYMAPEQVEHPADVDHRADIYALGVVFYQMLTGELPGRRLEPPSAKVQIDVRLDEVVLRALEKDPARRYAQASVLKTQVETIAATPPRSSRREEAQNGEPEARFSRTAIVGACWAGFSFVTVATVLMARYFPLSTLASSPVWRTLTFLNYQVLGLSGFFGATILGWMAVSQIRRSEGKLHGMWLAVFDGLLFPLLLLDGAIVATVFLGLRLLDQELHRVTTPVMIPVSLLAMVVLGIIGLVDYLIIRRVWRAVNAGSAGAPPAEPARKHSTGKMIAIGCGVLVTLLASVVFVNMMRPKNSPGAGDTYHPLLRVTVRVLDLPAGFDDAQLLRPSGLLDSGEVKILAAPYVVVPSGSEGAIQIPEAEGIEPGFLPLLSGRTKTLYVKPTLENGSFWVHYSLDGLVREVGTNSQAFKRQQIRSDSVRLGELEVMESNGLADGRRQLAVLSVETEILKADAGGNLLTRQSPTAFGPVIERVLNDISERRGNEALQLESGQLLTLPAPNRESKARYSWLKANQADLLVDFNPNHRLTLAAGLKLADFQASDWDIATAADLAKALQTEASGIEHAVGPGGRRTREKDYWLTKEPIFPVTLAFETPSGQRGLLQVTDVTTNPRGLKLRYKLALAQAPPAPITSGQPGSAANPIYVWCDKGETEAVLPHGGRLRLLAIGDQQRWWTPQGQPLPDTPEWRRFRENWSDSKLIALVAQLHPNVESAAAKIGPAGEEWQHPVLSAFGISPKPGERPQLNVGFGAGPWQTAPTVLSPAQTGLIKLGDAVCSVESLEQQAAATRLTPPATLVRFWLMHPQETESALVAVGKDGRQQALGFTWGAVDSAPPPWQRWDTSGTADIELDRFELRTRPRAWAGFVGFATQPLTAEK